MSKDKQRLADYLAHMLQAIERITRYTELLDDFCWYCQLRCIKRVGRSMA
jgi:uncharacterized protein with HEPN domain